MNPKSRIINRYTKVQLILLAEYRCILCGASSYSHDWMDFNDDDGMIEYCSWSSPDEPWY